MAPADKRGYRLLPQDDLSAAGGPLRGKPPLRANVSAPNVANGHARVPEAKPRAATEETETTEEAEDGDEDIQGQNHGYVKYDGARRYDMSASGWVIHPYDKRVQRWYACLCLLLVADVIYLPLEIAFGRYMSQSLLLTLDFVCTLIFSIDIVLQFFLQIPSPKEDFWVFNHEKIITSYLKGNFCLDLIGVIPFGELHVLVNSIPRMRASWVSYSLHALRFLKFFRMLRLRRIVHRHIYDMSFTHMQRAILYSCATMAVSLHLMGCVWATLANYQPGVNWLTELSRLKEEHLHGSASFLEVHHDSVDASLVTYITSFYFALYTLTGIGYGDIGPSTLVEYMFLICLMLVGSLIWASIIGEIVNVLRHEEFDDAHHQQTMDELMKLGRDYSFDPDVLSRLRAYLVQSRSITRSNFVRTHIIPFMSNELAIQLCHTLHGRWYEQIWWLKNVSRSAFVVQLTLAFDPILFAPKEFIKTTERMYVIERGLCVHGSQILSKNQCFGMDMLLTQEHLRVNLTTLALSYLHMLYLTRSALQNTLERFPREQELVRRSYRTLCLFRGLIWKAREAKQHEKRTGRSASLFSALSTPGSMPHRVSYPSMALESKAGDQEIAEAINETRDRLEKLETNLGRRIEVIEDKVQDALDAISEFIKKKKRGPNKMFSQIVQ